MRQSSIEAHEAIKPKKEDHYSYIKKAMNKIGEAAISKRIATYCPELDYHAVARRLSEMENKGIVKVVGRLTNVPSKPMLWKLTS